MGKRFGLATGLLTAFVLLLAVNLIAGMLLRNAKVDLTEEKLFTLSDGSASIVGRLTEKIRLKLFYSRRAAASFPPIKQYADRVTELLKQYEAASGGKLSLEILEPRPDTEIEEQAVKYGLKGIPGPEGENIYLGLAIASETGAEQAIPFLEPSRESFLEYDITRLISAVEVTDKQTIGVMSSLSMLGGPGNDPMARLQQRPPQPPWVFVQELRQQYKVEEVSATAETISPEIDLLLVVHPKGIQPATEYAIDQYLMKGGRVMVFVDPLCVYEQINFQSPDMNQRFQATFDSNLPKLLSAWGMELVAGKVVGDLELATEIQMRPGQVQRHPAILTLTGKQCNPDEIISSELENLIVANAGVLKKKEGEGATNYKMTPILQSTAGASELDAFMLKFGADPDQIRRDFVAGKEALPIAVKLTGKFQTAFPAGKPASTAPPDENQPGPTETPAHVAEAEKENTVLIVSDADILADDFSVRKQNLFGQVLAFAINDNLAFANNAVENLLGSQELISLRSRGKSRRPFARVDQLEGEAQARFKEEEQQLVKKEQDAQTKLRELESGKDEGGRAVLSAEQLTEIENFRKELAETKQRLREVRRNLRQDIENLGTRLKVVNIALLPILVLVAGFLPPFLRARKMRSMNNG